uniref:Nonstructural protein n=1 Tax=Dulem virus 168 TaxID=3145645 RepID=A0AAU8B953_9VIRU
MENNKNENKNRANITEMYAIYDRKSDSFGFPFPSDSKGTAVRQVAIDTEDPKNPLNKFAEDFDLYLISEYDKKTGTLAHYERPVFVMGLLDIVNKK